MRIVGGTYRGKRLASPVDNAIRPTSDRVREAIFNVLSHNVPPLPFGAAVLDLFCGTGAFGLEAISRGARTVTFVDEAPSSLRLARDNATSLGVQSNCTFVKADAARLRNAPSPADLVFADPPYGKSLIRPALIGAIATGWIGETTVIIVETPTGEDIELPEEFLIDRQWIYGQTKITRISLAS
ncbi:MAG: 16S rRNA (guanine(966)-N(2))-methyltransferase RsmD [Alphaproteobacteria bacterium]|nr:MAG: 16S rRNA (guanine(966)-N(2))-methyltransferase RsmD [Alphaproteobacteria bacterium]